MCGRSSLFVGQLGLETRFDAGLVAHGGYTLKYIAPGGDLEVITNEATTEINQYHWGLIPISANGPVVFS